MTHRLTALVRTSRASQRQVPPSSCLTVESPRHSSRPTETLEQISVDPLVCHGQACLKGTRIPVSVVLDCLADGMAIEQITEQYPSLSTAAVRAAAAYGAELAREEMLPLSVDR